MKTKIIIFLFALIAIIGVNGCAIGIGLKSGGNILGDWTIFHWKVENMSDKPIKLIFHSINATKEIILPPSGWNKDWMSVIKKDKWSYDHVQIVFQFYVPDETGGWKLIASDHKDIRDGRMAIITWYGSGKKPYRIE